MSDKEKFLNQLQSRLKKNIEEWNSTDASSNSVQLPLTLGDYVLISKLGQGGMGVVYGALHVRLDKKVAVKVLSADRMNNAEALGRFARETMAIGKLMHPNIIQALDAREENGTYFLVLEYVDGADLEKLAEYVAQFEVADICEIMRQAADGLQHAHENGLVHRDIKPSNLFLALSKDSERRIKSAVVKILDLGLAQIVADSDKGNLTGTQQIMGTLDYIAPEQIQDSRSVDIRSDLYSLGCSFYFLLTRHRPFARHVGQYQKMQAHVESVPETVDLHRSDIPAELSAIVMKLLSKKPEERFATPRQLSHALAPFCTGADLVALAGHFEANRNARHPGSFEQTKKIELSETEKSEILKTLDSNRDSVPTGNGSLPTDNAKSVHKLVRWGLPSSLFAGLLFFFFWNNPLEEQAPLTEPNSSAGNVPAVATQDETVDEAKYRYEMEFDGVDDFIETDFLYDDSTLITLELWATPRIVDTPGKRAFMSNAETAGFSFALDRERHPTFLLHDGDGYVKHEQSQKELREVETHYVAIYDGISLSLFVDGTKQGRSIPVRKRHHPSPLPVYIGCNPDPELEGRPQAGYRNLFTGTMREVRISKGAIYQKDFVPAKRLKSDASTILLYRFTKNDRNTVKDLSGNNHDGIIHGNAKIIPWKETDTIQRGKVNSTDEPNR